MFKNIGNRQYWQRKEVLVSGGTGSLGTQIIKTIIQNDLNVKGIRIYSRDEAKQWNMRQSLKNNTNIPISYIIGDIRDYRRFEEASKGVDIVIHTAALKQVDTAEENPIEYVRTNITGTENVMRACIKNKVQKAILISTDKAVLPLNLYGATKMTAEKLWLKGEVYTGGKDTEFGVIRYGNVIGSRGSIVDLIKKLEQGQKIPVTDPDMTRFWIPLPNVAHFILNIINELQSSCIYIPKMSSCSLSTFLKATTGTTEKDWDIIGFRPGEKKHECLFNQEEATKVDTGVYYTIYPKARQKFVNESSILTSENNPFYTRNVKLIKGLTE